MAKYNDVLGVIREYRNELEQKTQVEVETNLSSGLGMMTDFAARGAMSAFSTPLSNVHATGVGVRVRKGKVVDDEFVIKVYVYDKFDLGDRVPDLTKHFSGVDIDVEPLPIQQALENSVLAAGNGNGITQPLNDPTVHHRVKQTPIMGGVSIAPVNEAFAGTLGCFLHRITNGVRQVFALSNNHVMADGNRLAVGTPIVQPGPELGFMNTGSTFCALSNFVPIQFPNGRLEPVINSFDAAISIVADETLITTGKILGIPNFNPQVAVALPGMKVVKSGRTTGVTMGTITSTRVNAVQINYGTRTSPRIAIYNDTIQIVSDDENRPFSLPGDSGSIIVERSSGRPVGLLFAGDGRRNSACDLGGVCKQFNAFPV